MKVRLKHSTLCYAGFNESDPGVRSTRFLHLMPPKTTFEFLSYHFAFFKTGAGTSDGENFSLSDKGTTNVMQRISSSKP
jgi:hypothetical protein